MSCLQWSSLNVITIVNSSTVLFILQIVQIKFWSPFLSSRYACSEAWTPNGWMMWSTPTLVRKPAMTTPAHVPLSLFVEVCIRLGRYSGCYENMVIVAVVFVLWSSSSDHWWMATIWQTASVRMYLTGPRCKWAFRFLSNSSKRQTTLASC